MIKEVIILNLMCVSVYAVALIMHLCASVNYQLGYDTPSNHNRTCFALVSVVLRSLFGSIGPMINRRRSVFASVLDTLFQAIVCLISFRRIH